MGHSKDFNEGRMLGRAEARAEVEERMTWWLWWIRNGRHGYKNKHASLLHESTTNIKRHLMENL